MMDSTSDEGTTPVAGDQAGKSEAQQKREDQVLAAFQRRFKASKSHFKDWRSEARQLYQFEAGHQWDPEDAQIMEDARKPMVTFNLASKFIDAVVGLQINNRQEIKYFPRQEGKAGVSDVATGAVKWNRDQSDAEDEETDAFRDVILTGMGFVEHRLEDTLDPDGWIAQERRDPLEIFPDPSARKRNLSDGRFIIRLVPYTKEAYEEAFGTYQGDPAQPSFQLEPEQEPEFIKVPQDYDEEDEGEGAVRNHLYAALYQWWELEDRIQVNATLPDLQSGQPKPMQQTFKPEEWAALQTRMDQQKVPYQARKIRTRCYYQATITGKGIFSLVELPVSGFTIKAITGKRDRNSRTWFGLGRNIKDPNLWVNKFFSSILWTLAVNPKGGLLAERGVFENQAEAEASWADPSKITFVEDGALTDGRVQPKPAQNYPQGMDRLMQFSLEAMPEVSGLNLELMGLADRQQAGVLEAQRKQSAMAIIAWAFDAMRRYYKESGRIMLELIREFMADGRLIRIVGEEGAQYVQLLKDKLTGTFDIIVDEAPTSTNMQERTWAILQDIIPVALKSGIKIPPQILDYAPIPEDLSQKWKQLLQPSPEDQQHQQDQVMLMVKKALAEIYKDQTQGDLNKAKAQQIQETTPVKNMETAARAGILQATGGAPAGGP